MLESMDSYLHWQQWVLYEGEDEAWYAPNRYRKLVEIQRAELKADASARVHETDVGYTKSVVFLGVGALSRTITTSDCLQSIVGFVNCL